MSDQPILGSLAWMNQSMRTVRPVFDGNNITAPIYLVGDDGKFLKGRLSVGADDETREAGGIELREDGTFELREGVEDTFLIAGTTTIGANLVRWI